MFTSEEPQMIISTVIADSAYSVEVYNESVHNDFSLVAWLKETDTDKPVAMARFFTPTEQYGGFAVLCDIETRPDRRGEGLARNLIEILNKNYGTLHTSGSYSVSGYDAFGEHMPLVPSQTILVDKRTVAYEFVDWEEGQLKR